MTPDMTPHADRFAGVDDAEASMQVDGDDAATSRSARPSPLAPTVRLLPILAALLAAGGGWIGAGLPGLLALLPPLACLWLPPRHRLWPLVGLAFIPTPPLASAQGLLAGGLLLTAVALVVVDCVGWHSREGRVGLAAFVVLALLGMAAIPRVRFFFEADAGLASFFLGGAALLSLGIALALAPAGDRFLKD